MGIRSLLEHIMISKVGDNGNFMKNLQEFEKNGFISHLQKQRIETILEASHAIIHRSFTPSCDELIILIYFAESLIDSICLHDIRIQILKDQMPWMRCNSKARSLLNSSFHPAQYPYHLI
jgi:uncharacterized protein DUF4145